MNISSRIFMKIAEFLERNDEWVQRVPVFKNITLWDDILLAFCVKEYYGITRMTLIYIQCVSVHMHTVTIKSRYNFCRLVELL